MASSSSSHTPRKLLCSLLLLISVETILASDRINRPKAIYKVAPVYTDAARQAHVQGISGYEILIGTDGSVISATLTSPLGFGLDESARDALKQWQFRPATRDGIPVQIRMSVEVRFRLSPNSFDQKMEERRAALNRALLGLSKSSPLRNETAIKVVQRLSKKNFPPAMLIESQWLASGDFLPKDPDKAAALLRKAVDKNYGPALFEMGRQMVDSDPSSAEGTQLIHDASTLGVPSAQLFLGRQAESSSGNIEQARRYYRLCAAQGEAACQLNLANLLLDRAQPTESDRIQGAAWLQLASQKLSHAKPLWDREQSQLTDYERAAAQQLSAQLLTYR